MRHKHCRTWQETLKKVKNLDVHTVRPGIWQETLKNVDN